ncbi:PspC domain-containing protein [Jatrophihabitans endophyticus]|uniref:PspC domain-containing protein n=1 Tax=Jatrophihabitans endophyticus TaxID=1206085 RepID=UPI0019FC7566|nr:PspC domain-containing protein [Jatrophihabitans endophyticus]MBE7190057.1 PspC domain-containing protein [Jatrophihabitans endophyticus]
MTETDTRPLARPRLLRRSRTERFAAGVCGGLGEYFGVDPILFRVLFAVAALFGGSGVLAYLLAWAVIPEQGTERAPVDGVVRKLREHRVPLWAVAIAVGLLLWATAFSWWAPGPFVPVVAVVVLVVVFFSRRDWQGTRPGAPTVSLTKDAVVAPSTTESVRAWVSEAKSAARERRRRALPVKIATLGGMAVVLVVLAALDAVKGVPMVLYFWTVLGFVTVGLLVGLVLRRTPWSVAILLPVSLAGVLALGGSHAAFHDGVGQKTWGPAQLASSYRLGVGQATLDLRHLSAVSTTARTTRVTVGVGQLRILVPADANVEIQANVHIGQIQLSSRGNGLRRAQNAGVGAHQVFPAPSGAVGQRLVVDVHVADGQVTVERR